MAEGTGLTRLRPAVVRRRIHKVGVTAGVAGLACMMLLPFAVLRPNRIATGSALSLLASAGPVRAALLVGLWLAVFALSLAGGRGVALGAARGLAASVIVVATLWVSGSVASDLAASAGRYTRVSVGGGAWAAMAAAYFLIVASRRETVSIRWASVGMQLVAPLGIVALAVSGALADMGIAREYVNVAERYGVEIRNHLAVSAGSLAVALVVGLALGVVAFTVTRLQRPVLATVSVFQTIPGLAMIGILVAPLAALARNVPALAAIGVGGIGWAPVAIALVLYALLVIVHDTVAGLQSVSRDAVESARAMGMTPPQVMRKVRLPLASPVIYTGGRTAALQTIGNATLGAFAGGWSLGIFITQGLAEGSNDLVLVGALSVVALALVVDAVVRAAEPLAVPLVRRKQKAEVTA